MESPAGEGRSEDAPEESVQFCGIVSLSGKTVHGFCQIFKRICDLKMLGTT